MTQDPFGLLSSIPTGVTHVDVTGVTDWVVLDRITDQSRADTPYCVHGQTPCQVCGQWCWLGNRTHAQVAAGQARPICHPCALAHIPPGTPTHNLEDHRRADGPH